jgi:hypothetical protein
LRLLGGSFSSPQSFVYIHFGFKWVNTLDVLLSFALLITFSVGTSLKGLGQGQKSLGGYLAGTGHCTVGNRKIPQQNNESESLFRIFERNRE